VGDIENIRARIGDFAGYDTDAQRRTADEQIRAFVGERLAALPAAEIDSLPPEERERYDRVLLRAEFMNQIAFRALEEHPAEERINALLAADEELVSAANELARADGAVLDGLLERVERAFDRRDSAMTGA
jgi:hypothetical protein